MFGARKSPNPVMDSCPYWPNGSRVVRGIRDRFLPRSSVTRFPAASSCSGLYRLKFTPSFPTAMAMAKPVVAFNLAEARASAGDGGAYAADDTPEALAAELDRLLDHPELRERMGAEGRRRVTNELSWERSRASLLAAYERVLSLRT